MMLDLEKLRATPVATDPFRHVVVPAFVPAASLSAVVGDLPAMAQRGSFPISALRFGAQASALMRELEAAPLREAIAEKFGLDLGDAGTMVTLRGQSGDRDGQIHTDSAAKRVTVLLYLNPATAAWARQEGCLRLLRGPTDLEDYAVEVPPIDGTLLVFPNGPNTWHGHKKFFGQRYVVQLNYMTADRAARAELRRHKFSAFVKRLTNQAA
ncbi:MAG: 2OG-Fe(II) oxygenase [Acetobacteraceae bacterium]|nr:2OG-Fe(II) oxygenase [Acetobacteraceae bacterium]